MVVMFTSVHGRNPSRPTRKGKPRRVKHVIQLIDHPTPALGLAIEIDHEHVLDRRAAVCWRVCICSRPLPSKKVTCSKSEPVRHTEGYAWEPNRFHSETNRDG